MDALGNYLGVLWKNSMQRMTVMPDQYGAQDYAAYDRQLARRPKLEYSPATSRWEVRGNVRSLYLATRNGEVLARPGSEAA